MALDERLRRELEQAGRPADPTGVYEELIRRHERRRGAKRLKMVALTAGVIAATAAGVVALSNVFEPSSPSPGIDPDPVPIGSYRNGRIAYSLSGPGGMELHTILPDGSGDRVVPTPPGLPWLPAWSPDGSQLAVAIFPTGGGDRAIWVLDVDGSNAVKVGSAENVSVPSWSPDGSAIAYSASADGRTEIHLVSPDGTGERVIHTEGAEGTFAIFSAKFSPDGREILFDRGTDSGFDIFVMAVDGTNVRQLTTTGSDYDPHWSPDGSRISFTRQGEGAQSDIYVMNADGTDVQQLTDGGDGVTNLYPNWAPDGTAIAYVAGVTGGPGPLIVMNPDGSEPSTLVDGEVLGIAWQPLPAAPVAPTPYPTPEPSFGEDIGLGYPVCDVTSVRGVFDPGVQGTAFVATRASDTGGCPTTDGGVHLLAVDVDGDGASDVSYEPLVCDPFCSAFAAPDVDGDGLDELLVQNVQFSIAGLELYEVIGDLEIVPITIGASGSEGFEGGTQPQFWVGGDAGDADAIRCEPNDLGTGPARALVSVSSHHEVDSGEDTVVTETTFLLKGTFLSVVDVNEFTWPANDDTRPFLETSGCGADLEPTTDR